VVLKNSQHFPWEQLQLLQWKIICPKVLLDSTLLKSHVQSRNSQAEVQELHLVGVSKAFNICNTNICVLVWSEFEKLKVVSSNYMTSAATGI
jgi:hypothetical protein